MSGFADLLRQVAKNLGAPDTTQRDDAEKNAKLRQSPAIEADVDGLPVFSRPYHRMDGDNTHPGTILGTDRLAHGKSVHPAMLDGMTAPEIGQMYMDGTFLHGMYEDNRAQSANGAPGPTMAPRPSVQVGPDQVYHKPMDPAAMPGSKYHPVEMKYGAYDNAVQANHGHYDPAFFTDPNTMQPMTHAEAARMIAGQLTARRMRVMGAQDPSMQRQPGQLDPMMLDLFPGQNL
jgi:hypothetical protein